jgi:ABC-2 type transport system permease protein
VRTYLAFFAAGFRRWSAYRTATAAGAFTNSVFGLVKASITVAAIGAAGGMLAGYDAQEGATYAWLAQAVIAPVYVFGWDELAQRVRTGDIAVDLARPVDLQTSWLAADLGRAAYSFLPRGLPPLAVGAVTFGLALPGSATPYLLGFVSLVLAVAVSFACRFAMNLSAFWLLDVRGPVTLYVVATNVLCGLVVPVHWFPPWLGTLAALTPFPSMLQAPVDVVSGHVLGTEAFLTVGIQLGWLAGALLLGRVVLARATEKLVVQGG